MNKELGIESISKEKTTALLHTLKEEIEDMDDVIKRCKEDKDSMLDYWEGRKAGLIRAQRLVLRLGGLKCN